MRHVADWMPANDLTALVDKIVKSRKGTGINVPLSLDLCDVVKLKTGHARPVLQRILDCIHCSDKRQSFFALNLLEVLVLNGGFPVRFVVSRKEWLNGLVRRFPAAPRKSPDDVEDYICMLLAKWSLSLSERSRFREEFANFTLMKQLLVGRGFKMPKVPQEEVDAMLVDELQPTLASKEEVLAEERSVLETKLDYHLSRKEPEDMKKANELIKVLSGYEDRAWKDEVINAALRSQLEELDDKIHHLDMLSGDNRTAVLGDLRNAAPRLANLARSESLSGDLMAQVLQLNDRLLAVLDGGDAKQAGDAKQTSDAKQRPRCVESEPPQRQPSAHDAKVFIDSVAIGTKHYIRILNHSSSTLHHLSVLQGSAVIGAADFLCPAETFTAQSDSPHSISVMYKGLDSAIQLDGPPQ